MRVVIAGGGLQGTEAAYLAGKAGWRVRLVDRRPQAPAVGLCDELACREITAAEGPGGLLDGADLLLPALEDAAALRCLERWSQAAGVPLAFDPRAYAVTASKAASNRLFERLGLPLPRPWPACGLPLIAKPDGASGSRGVRLIEAGDCLADGLPPAVAPEGWVLQEFVPGACHSVEVIGFGGRYGALQVTDLELDAGFDCKRVRAPSALPPAVAGRLRQMALEVAGALELNGIMDLEAVRCGDDFRVLEADARLPSQTPLTVFWSTGLNMVKALGELFCGRRSAPPGAPPARRAVVLEHLRFNAGLLEVAGEHLMAAAGPLRVVPGFFGAREAITDHRPGAEQWVAAVVVTGSDRHDAWRRRNRVIAAIIERCGVRHYVDLPPPAPRPAGEGS